jgi:hypothetical protein
LCSAQELRRDSLMRIGVGSAKTLCCSSFAAICSDADKIARWGEIPGRDRDLSIAATHKRLIDGSQMKCSALENKLDL